MRLSAIVPTHNRTDVLRQCLASLRAQTVDPHRFEVVVVDDGSEADMRRVVEDASAGGPILMRCERQPLTGLNGARNRGAATATGSVLAFLDDDTIVSPGWAEAVLDAFERRPCAAVGGKVELGLAGPAPAWLAVRRYYLAEYDLGPEGHWLRGDPVPVGANCAVRRGEFERLGGFHLGLDRIGGSLVSNGDTEFFHRLRAAGGRLWYEPEAHVVHCVPVERLTVEYFLERHFAQGVSDELLLTIQEELPNWRRRTRTCRELARHMLPMAKTVGKDIVRGRGTVNARFFTRYWRGRLSAVGMRPPRVEQQ
jgi:GT2 family glycosyltransferase